MAQMIKYTECALAWLLNKAGVLCCEEHWHISSGVVWQGYSMLLEVLLSKEAPSVPKHCDTPPVVVETGRYGY